jgi:hypothetical protein
MTRSLVAFLSLVAFAAAAARAPAAEEKEKSKSDPAGVPVEIKVVLRKDTIPLDLGGQSTEEFKKALDEAKKTGKYPAATAVDLEVVFTNTGEKDISLQFGGDSNRLNLEVKGPGAVSAETQRIFTREFRAPKPVVIAAGKSHSIALKGLQYGYRGVSHQAYLTAPGDYTITAVYQTAVSPAPKDAKDAGDGFGAVTFTSAPAKLKVEEKK